MPPVPIHERYAKPLKRLDEQDSPRSECNDSGSSSGRLRKSNGDPLVQHGYSLLGPIAAGAFSQVQRARHKASGREVAVKTFNKQKYLKAPHLADSMRNELQTLQVLQARERHPAIANMIECCETRQLTHCILEYCSGGSLARRMQSSMLKRVGLDEPDAACITFQVASALEHLHGLGIAHRDIKPENILYRDARDSRVKLCDFGFAKLCLDKRLKTVCGSPQYMAPEVNGRESYAGFPVDIWALGALIFELMHAKAAFRGNTMEQLTIRILRASHEAFDPKISPSARSLIKGMLQVDPTKRLKASAVTAHEWHAPGLATEAARVDRDPQSYAVAQRDSEQVLRQ